MSRIIELNLTQNDITQINETIGTWQELWKIVGYLSSWNTDSYPKVVIERSGDTDLVAHYYREDGKIGYTLGAIWHDDHYGIHS
jgi:hypothetical protein